MVQDAWTALFHEADAGAPGAKDRLFAALYQELHQLAERQLRAAAGASISPTTLLHEAYLGLQGSHAVFPNRDRFMGYAARMMRNLIIDFTRQRRAEKRGAGFHITQLDDQIADQLSAGTADDARLRQLSTALDELAARDARLAEVVDLRYFCGLTIGEIAALHKVSERTVQRDWDKARLILMHELDSSCRD
jgi:RNA polymerase sigma factor (TIGR02999 family)